MATTVTLKPNAIDLSGSTSGTTTLQATAVAGTTTITLPAATDTLVGKATTDTLTNKTLTSPTLTTPVLGTPSSGTLTSCTGLPLTTGVTGTLAVANGGTGVTTSTGSGANVLGTSPTIATPTITGDASISGQTVGKGGSAVSTNTAHGVSALTAITSGDESTGVGYFALKTATTSGANTAFGAYALRDNTGASNTAVGRYALIANSTGTANSALGSNALNSNTTGGYNTSLGLQSLYSNTTASNNTAVGYQAGYSNTTGADKTIIGYQAGYSDQTGARSTFIGKDAGYTATATDGDIYIGHSAGKSVTTGNNNVFVGGRSNVGINAGAGFSVTTGTYNNFFGGDAGGLVTTGSKNSIFGNYDGNQGGLDIRTASNYIVLSDGDGNPRQVIDSSGNVGIGTTSPNTKLEISGSSTFIPTTTITADNAVTGWRVRRTGGTYPREYYIGIRENSTALDFYDNTADALRMRIDSSGSLFVGATSFASAGKIHVGFAGNTINGLTLQTTFGSTGSNYLAFYNSAGTNTGTINQNGTTTVAYSTSSDYRLKENIVPMTGALATVAQLKPVTYKWKSDGSDGQGFIAHELQAIVPDCVVGEKDALDADGNPKYQGVDTSFLVATLTAAIQELKAINDSLTARIVALESK